MSHVLKLSIIIVNWNVRELLRESIMSVKREVDLPRDQYEIIVVDNASSDNSVEMLAEAYPDVKVLANSDNLGFAAACNQGYAMSRGRYIWLLNPDTVVLEGSVAGILSEMESRPEAGIIGCRLLDEQGELQRASGGAFPSLANVAWNYLFLKYMLPGKWAPAPLFFDRDLQGVFEVDWVSGAAMLLRREAVGKTIFDESFFMFGEDMEVCDRLRREGWKVLYSGESSIVHYHGCCYKKQSSIDILATAIKGPRRFFKRKHGRTAIFLYDLFLLVGYLIRWPVFRFVSLLRPGRGYSDLSALSRRYVFVVFRLLWE